MVLRSKPIRLLTLRAVQTKVDIFLKVGTTSGEKALPRPGVKPSVYSYVSSVNRNNNHLRITVDVFTDKYFLKVTIMVTLLS